MAKHKQVGNAATSPQVPDYLDDDSAPTNEELTKMESNGKKKKTAKGGNKTKAKAKTTKATKTSKKKTTKKKTASGHKGGYGDFAPKLESNAGKEIEKRFTNGEGLSTIAKDMGVSVNTVRYRFLQFLIKETYNFESAE